MDVKNIKREDGKLSFQVSIDAASFEEAVNKAYLKAKKSISVPGFRKGKAPRMVIEGMYGAGVFYEDAVDALALDAYRAGMEEAKDRVVGDPAISNYNVAEDKSLTIDFETALYPEVTLGQYKGIEAYRAPVKVLAEDVNRELEVIRKRNARIVSVDRAAKLEDTVNIDYDGYKDGVRFDGGKAEGHDLVLGSGSFVPGFEEQLVGMKAGEEKDLDITFPENYHEGLAGAAVVFKVKVNEVKETQLPALDDEFAKDVSEFDTLKEYKASVKKELEESRKLMAENDYRDLLMKKAIDNMTVTVPDAMINERVEALVSNYARNFAAQGYTLEQYLGMMGMRADMFRSYLRPQAENEVKSELLLEKVAELENIEVPEADIENEYKTAAEQYQMEIEQLKQSVPSDIIIRDLKLRKASELIISAGVAVDKMEDAAPADEAKPAAKKSTKKATTEKKPTAAKADAEKKPAAKKTTTEKKPAAAKADAEKKPAAKKATTEKKPAAAKASAEKKPAAKKTTTAKKSTAKKTEE